MKTAVHKGNELVSLNTRYVNNTKVSLCDQCYFGAMRDRPMCQFGFVDDSPYHCTDIIWMTKPEYIAHFFTKEKPL